MWFLMQKLKCHLITKNIDKCLVFSKNYFVNSDLKGIVKL